MSYSSLWLIDKDFKGEEDIEFMNSWLFTPIAHDILFKKYLSSRATSPYDNKDLPFLSAVMLDNTVIRDLNNLINYCEVQEDRVVWELTNQQMFRTKDKDFISDCIIKFMDINKELMIKYDERIFSRFKEVAREIRNIDENNYSYFIFKNTSCDDGVEYWFIKYDEEEKDYKDASLLELDTNVCELVLIDNNKISDFIINTKLKDYINCY